MKHIPLFLALFIFGCSKNDSELIKSNVFGVGTYTPPSPNTGNSLEFSTNNIYFDDTKINWTPVSVKFTVRNKTNSDVILSEVVNPAENFKSNKSAGYNCYANTTRDFFVEFKPTSLGYFQDSIIYKYNGYSYTVFVNGRGISQSGGGGGGGSGTPILNYPAGGTLNFGDVYNGSSVTKTITISNTGTAVANWSNNRTDYTLNPPSGSINAGSTQNINVTYTATSTGTYNSNIILSYNSTNLQIPFTVNRLATSSGTRILNVTPSSTSFGLVPINTSQSKSVNIANSGTQPLNITSITMTGAAGVWSVDNYSGAIQPGASINVNVTFSPKSKINYNGTLTVNSDKTSGINTKGFMGSGN